ncbi:MAG: tetratricopeptide repeat protein, partial [Candidatus Marinimicrobia bacterium]|nr:tetratricopeptide repeat protein [Candidatus Neomarinimicrobiota bacterium]
AFYLLGEQSLLTKRDFVKADYYYKQIQREASKSIFNELAKKRINELDQFNKSKDFLSEIDNKNSKVDSITVDHLVDSSKIALALYNLGELEAFHFNQIDTSVIYFNRIIEYYPSSDLKPKVIYVLGHLYEQLGDTSQSLKYQELIMNIYPDSEYADNIRLNNKLIDYGVGGFELLSNVEYLYSVNSDSALIEYKKIADLSNSETSKRALFFIANEYDYKSFDPDSAHKYYNQIAIRFPESEQSKIAIDRLKYLNVGKIDNTGSTVK